MNKVITINLGGTAFQLEEAGYDALRAYLDSAAGRLQGNPDRDEIMSDIEQAIADKFRAQLSAHKNVVLTREVTAVIEQMGPIQDDSSGATASEETTANSGCGTSSGTSATTDTGSGPRAAKRLYCIHEGSMLLGVCSGIGAYFNIDPTFVRLAFVLLTFVWGFGIVVYLVLGLVIPDAETPEQKAAAYGVPATAQEFIRRAKQGYYGAMKSFPDKQARKEWKRRFKQDMRDWRHSFRSEMRAQGQQWRESWQQQCSAHPGLGLALPFISLVHGLLILVILCAFVSLFATGAIFGVVLPAGLPLWVAAILLLIGYGMIVWPLKAMRRACYFGGWGMPGPAWSLFFVLDVLIWLAVVGFIAWLALHHSSEVRDAVRAVPGAIHEAANAIRDWWKG